MGHFENAIFTHHVLKTQSVRKLIIFFAVNVHCGGKKGIAVSEMEEMRGNDMEKLD